MITVDGKDHNVSFGDTPTEDRVRLRCLNYPATNIVLIIFAIDNRSSFKYITEPPSEDKDIGARALIQEIQDILHGVPLILVGSKADKPDREISKEEAKELQTVIQASSYMEYSHKDWDSMQSILEAAVRLGNKHYESIPKEVPAGTTHGDAGGGGTVDDKCCIIL